MPTSSSEMTTRGMQVHGGDCRRQLEPADAMRNECKQLSPSLGERGAMSFSRENRHGGRQWFMIAIEDCNNA